MLRVQYSCLAVVKRNLIFNRGVIISREFYEFNPAYLGPWMLILMIID